MQTEASVVCMDSGRVMAEALQQTERSWNMAAVVMLMVDGQKAWQVTSKSLLMLIVSFNIA